MYTMNRQLAKGKLGEERIDRLVVSIGYISKPVGADMERRGIDRILTTPDGRTITAEYKTDFKMMRTQNMFIETKVVQADGRWKMGWALRSEADVLLYWAHPGSAKINSPVYVFDMKKLRWHIPSWTSGEYTKIVVQNNGYHGEGYAVPIERVCYAAKKAVLTMKKEFLQ